MTMVDLVLVNAFSSSLSPSSSSPTKKKTSKLSPVQKILFKKPNSSSSSWKATSLAKRQETVFRKAEELSILCGIEVCVIYYGPDGELKTWPEDREKVKDIARRYNELSEKKRRRGSVDLFEFLDKINKEDSKNKNNKTKKIMKKVELGSNNKYPDWNPRFENYSEEQLEELAQSLESKQTEFKHRIQATAEPRKQNTNMADHQEHTMPTSTTMNRLQHRSTTMTHHLQQHSNQVPMYLFNHGNGTYSQIPVSALAFNQSQSLAPLPTPLTIYPDPNAGNYSSVLGVQESGINGFQNMNMSTYYNNNYNSSVNGFPKQISHRDGCSGLLGVQEIGVNKFQDTNMLTYNNNNSSVNGFTKQISGGDGCSGLLGVQETGVNKFQNTNMLSYNNNNSSVNGFPKQFSGDDGCSWLHGVQETGVNKFQDTNMYSCNNINVEDNDSGLLGVQDYGMTNELQLQNVNMYGGYDNNNNNNNNTNPNDLSQQLVQFPTQSAPPDFQFGSFRRQY